MAKDPAFLFYYQDFLVGTSFMTLEEIGAYIKLLCFQAAKGPLKEADILKKIPSPIWQSICCKFTLKGDTYINERLAKEIVRRQLYTESRRNNLHMGKHMGKHMVSHIDDVLTEHMETETETITITKNNVVTISHFEELWQKYPVKDGRKEALRHFEASVLTEQDLTDIQAALENYLKSDKVLKGFIKNGSTWFNNWKDWVNFVEPKIIDHNLNPADKKLIELENFK